MDSSEEYRIVQYPTIVTTTRGDNSGSEIVTQTTSGSSESTELEAGRVVTSITNVPVTETRQGEEVVVTTVTKITDARAGFSTDSTSSRSDEQQVSYTGASPSTSNVSVIRRSGMGGTATNDSETTDLSSHIPDEQWVSYTGASPSTNNNVSVLTRFGMGTTATGNTGTSNLSAFSPRNYREVTEIGGEPATMTTGGRAGFPIDSASSRSDEQQISYAGASPSTNNNISVLTRFEMGTTATDDSETTDSSSHMPNIRSEVAEVGGKVVTKIVNVPAGFPVDSTNSRSDKQQFAPTDASSPAKSVSVLTRFGTGAVATDFAEMSDLSSRMSDNRAGFAEIGGDTAKNDSIEIMGATKDQTNLFSPGGTSTTGAAREQRADQTAPSISDSEDSLEYPNPEVSSSDAEWTYNPDIYSRGNNTGLYSFGSISAPTSIRELDAESTVSQPRSGVELFHMGNDTDSSAFTARATGSEPITSHKRNEMDSSAFTTRATGGEPATSYSRNDGNSTAFTTRATEGEPTPSHPRNGGDSAFTMRGTGDQPNVYRVQNDGDSSAFTTGVTGGGPTASHSRNDGNSWVFTTRATGGEPTTFYARNDGDSTAFTTTPTGRKSDIYHVRNDGSSSGFTTRATGGESNIFHARDDMDSSDFITRTRGGEPTTSHARHDGDSSAFTTRAAGGEPNVLYAGNGADSTAFTTGAIGGGPNVFHAGNDADSSGFITRATGSEPAIFRMGNDADSSGFITRATGSEPAIFRMGNDADSSAFTTRAPEGEPNISHTRNETQSSGFTKLGATSTVRERGAGSPTPPISGDYDSYAIHKELQASTAEEGSFSSTSPPRNGNREEPHDLSPNGLLRVGAVILGLFFILIPLLLLILGIENAKLRGQSISYKGEVILRVNGYVATFFPLIFAAIASQTLRILTKYKAERGARLLTLEHLVGSRSFDGALLQPLLLRSFSVLGVGLGLIWVLCPLGGLSSLRMLHLGNSSLISALPLQYVDTNSVLHSDFREGNVDSHDELNSLFLASLIAPNSVQQSNLDTWGNVKIPVLPPQGNSDGNEWVALNNTGQSGYYSSMIGIPILGLPAEGVGNFTMKSAYFTFGCSSLINASWAQVDSAASPWSAGPVPTNPELVNGTGVESFLISADLSRNITYETPNATIYFISPWHDAIGDNGYSFATCQLGTANVESSLACQGTNCTVDQMRLSTNDTNGLVGTTLNSFLEDFATVSTGLDLCANSTLIERYMYNPSTAFTSTIADGSLRLYELPIDVFTQRLGLLLNTYYSASFAPTYQTSGLPANTSTVADVSPPSNAFPVFDASTVSNSFTLSDASTSSGPPVNSTTGSVTNNHEAYKSTPAWLVIYLLAAAVLLLIAIVGVVFSHLSVGPDILGYASSMTRDNQYIPVPKVGSTLGGIARARALRDTRVRVQDVWGSDRVGNIALSSGVGQPLRRKGRRYI